MTKLAQLRTMTTVVADTGDLGAIANLKPTDATTNPSLLLKAASLEEFKESIIQLQTGSLPIDDRVDQFAVAAVSYTHLRAHET